MSGVNGNRMFLLPGSGIDSRVYDGSKPLSTMSFVQASILQGKVFTARDIFSITAGSTYSISVVTGSSPVLVMDRHIVTDGTDLDYIAYVGLGDYTGGTPLVPSNLDPVNGVASETTVSLGATGTTTSGVTFDRDWIPGIAGQGNRSSGVFSESEVFRRAPSGSYLLHFINNSASTVKVHYMLMWREGVLPNDL